MLEATGAESVIANVSGYLAEKPYCGLMKKCGYCGRENDGQASLCSGCGSTLALIESTTQQRKSLINRGPLVWFGFAVAVGIAFIVFTRRSLPTKQPLFMSTENSFTADGASIQIKGSKRFQRQVHEALDLLMRKDPEDYLIVTQNLQVIKQGEHSGTRVGEMPPTLYLTEKTALHSLTWCAGDIVHDAYHHQLHRDYVAHQGPSVPVEVYSEKRAEQKCNAQQAVALKRLAAPAFEQTWLKMQDGSHYTVPYSNQNW